VSQLQLIDSRPGCQGQIFHVDNTCKGLTVMIPLCDMGPKNGPTVLLAQSHQMFPDFSLGRLRRFIFEDSSSSGSSKVIVAECKAGDALIYDSRTIHRGSSNLSDQSRPVLIVRVDYLESPPPGIGAAGTLGVNVMGNLLAWFV